MKSQIKEEIPDHCYRMWIDPIQFHENDGDTLVLTCPNLFSKKRVTDHYGRLLEEGVCRVAGNNVKIRFEVGLGRDLSQMSADTATQQQLTLPDMDPPTPSGRLLRKDFTFDQFVVGKKTAISPIPRLCRWLHATREIRTPFICNQGPALEKAIFPKPWGITFLARCRVKRVYYITAEDFMNEMTESYRTSSIHGFKEKYRRNCDVLLLEDVHFLSGKSGTQEELSSTLESAYERQ